MSLAVVRSLALRRFRNTWSTRGSRPIATTARLTALLAAAGVGLAAVSVGTAMALAALVIVVVIVGAAVAAGHALTVAGRFFDAVSHLHARPGESYAGVGHELAPNFAWDEVDDERGDAANARERRREPTRVAEKAIPRRGGLRTTRPSPVAGSGRPTSPHHVHPWSRSTTRRASARPAMHRRRK